MVAGFSERHADRRPPLPHPGDDFTRECLALVADTSLSGQRVVRELDIIIIGRGRPASIVSDNGTEFTSMAMLRWAQQEQIAWHYIAPGKPTPECLRRELQRAAPGRTPERDAINLVGSRPRGARRLAKRFQYRSTP